ncbi:type I polyketide synthase [Vallitalea guaymasensis]|uniref:type I polyketide synthase n=1 Tax=Vallitalea guaymasensis TaxID=1185412 RepID=UPI000DE2B284|nr:type I polyketide synthase [Vallitalea guaymasensis]
MNDNAYSGLDVAVIGMACRFPQARNTQEFWEIIQQGKETVTSISHDELIKNNVDESIISDPNYVTYGSYFEDKQYFDASFFNYLPSEAKIMDPQMRIFHECVWEGLEDAGCNPSTYKGVIGLFAGAGNNYNWQSLSLIEQEKGDVDTFSAKHLTNRDFMNSKIAYKLNLNGPVVNIQTACSTSLVSIHLASRSLLLGECNVAVAGGVTLLSTLKTGYMYREGMILSSDGHCRAFDENANGTVFGEGAGVVVLKRLKNAIADGDVIHAIIKGSAINNDGTRKIGYTAPSIDGQVEVMQRAQKISKVLPSTIGYIEAHGTGTVLGDPIEFEALKQAYGKDRTITCSIGSVKANIGHLDNAAGVASFIKTVLILKHKKIPPLVNFIKPNPKMIVQGSAFHFNRELKDWYAKEVPRRAAVSSLGIGGTNAHMILEEYTLPPSQPSYRKYQLITLSAMTKNALENMTYRMSSCMVNMNNNDLGNTAYTLATGRKDFAYRRFMVCQNKENVVESLQSGLKTYRDTMNNKKIIFMFPGQGSQYKDMGRELYNTEILFRIEIDKCISYIYKIYGITSNDKISSEEALYQFLNNPQYVQIAIFTFEYALCRYLINLGIKPDVMIGHSLGEYVAACISGVFTFEDAIRLLKERVRLVETLPKGNMLSVSMTRHEIDSILDKFNISLAAINGECAYVLSGKPEVIATVKKYLDDMDIPCNILPIDYAYHSNIMKDIFIGFRTVLKQINFNNPIIPYLSNVTGDYIQSNESYEDYWCKHMYYPVNYLGNIDKLLEHKENIWIEVGPGKILSHLVKQRIINDKELKKTNKLINLTRHPCEDINDQQHLLHSLGKLWASGIDMNWEVFYSHETRKVISLPTYPFEKIAYPACGDPYIWLSKRMKMKDLGKQQEISKWFYRPSWESKTLIPHSQQLPKKVNMLFGEDNSLSKGLVNRLKKNGEKVIHIVPGEKYKCISQEKYAINISIKDEYSKLINDIYSSQNIPDRIIHLGNTYSNTNKNIHEKIRTGFYSLIHLVLEMNNKHILAGREIVIVTSDLHKVWGTEQVNPVKGLTLGYIKVLAQEYPSVNTYNVDISLDDDHELIVSNIYHEIKYNLDDKVIAYRYGKRWVQNYQSFVLNGEMNKPGRLKKRGNYIIIGGLGRLGFILAKHLMTSYQSRVILFGRTPLSDLDKKKKKRLNQLWELGKESVIYQCGDISKIEDIKECMDMVTDKFTTINGIIHGGGVVEGQSINKINKLEKDAYEEQFSAKLYGVMNLREAVSNREVDFCLIISSLASVLGGLGYGAYAATNTFIDYAMQAIDEDHFIGINLEGLYFGKDSVNSEGYMINENEVINVMDRVMNSGIGPQIIVSSGSLEERVNKWVKQTEAFQTSDQQPEMIQERPDLSVDYNPPISHYEIKLHKIWKSFFAIEQIGIDDDFFELGGDSLKAMTLSKSIYHQLGIEIPLDQFFNHPTIKELAYYIQHTTIPKDIVKVEERKLQYFNTDDEQYIQVMIQNDMNIEAVYPLSHMQLTALNYNMMYSNKENSLQLVSWIMEDLDIERLQNAWDQVINKHSILRTQFIWRRVTSPIQVIYKTVNWTINLQDLREVEEDIEKKIGEYTQEIIKRGFKKIPYMDLVVMQVTDRKYKVTWWYKNLLFDGFSKSIILNDVMHYYNKDSKKMLYPKETLAYGQYIEWMYRQREEEAEVFWKEHMKGYKATSIISKKNNHKVTQEAKLYHYTLTHEEKNKVQLFAKENKLSLNTLLTASWAILHSERLAQHDILIGMLTSGRPLTLEGANNIVGLFTNILPIRVQVPEKISLSWLSDFQEKLLQSKKYEYVSIQNISKWGDISNRVLQEAIYQRTIVYVDYPSLNTVAVDNVSDYISYSGLIVPIRCILDGELNICIKYDGTLYSTEKVESISHKLVTILKQIINCKFDLNN